jgi:YMGG-like Gly-zipper
MRRFIHVAIGASMLSIASSALAQQKPIIYPAKGQSAEQQQKDDGECYVWAKQSTGIDPAAVAQTVPQQETGVPVGGGERVRGAAAGALGGVAIGAIAGNAGRGAAIGAVTGTMAGGRQARQNQKERNEQAQTQHQQVIATYYRAYGACMEGRGYTLR